MASAYSQPDELSFTAPSALVDFQRDDVPTIGRKRSSAEGCSVLEAAEWLSVEEFKRGVILYPWLRITLKTPEKRTYERIRSTSTVNEKDSFASLAKGREID